MRRRVEYYVLAAPVLLSAFLQPALALCGLHWADLAGILWLLDAFRQGWH